MGKRSRFVLAGQGLGLCALAATGLPSCGRSPLELQFDLGQSAGGSGGQFVDGVGAGGPFGPGGAGSGGLGSGGSSPGGTGGAGTGGVATGGAGTGGAGTGGGLGAGCSSDAECVVGDSCLVGRCVAGVCSASVRDRDGDGAPDALCGGDDCNDLNALASPFGTEDCRDAADNDCNGVADCLDPACRTTPDCGCAPAATGEICGSGRDEDCDGTIDCNDADCVGTLECGCSVENCDNGTDDDCDGLLDCADPDCVEAERCTCTARGESCSNGRDDDCDGLIDCSDPGCAFAGNCLCLVPEDESCTDGRDNDCDGLVDCGDPTCFAHPTCRLCVSEVCSGGQDEDCDGRVDCADPSCAFDAACPPAPELCNNERDDDFDGLSDCNDPDCQNTALCLEKQNTCATARRIVPLTSASYSGTTAGQLSNFRGSCGGDAGEAVFRLELVQPTRLHLDTIGTSFDSNLYVRVGHCAFGAELGCDDDSGGVAWSSALDFPIVAPGTYYIFVDGLTVDRVLGANEGDYVLNVEAAPADEICDDGIDNDGDVYADCADSDCSDAPGCAGCRGGSAAEPEFGRNRCTDGLDNDCDGLTDCEDDDCNASPENPTECCNGIDQNGNGIADDFNCRCASDDDCSGGQLCYTSTLSACGLPCDNFFGEICPFVAVGSSCNAATRQCQF